jgi:membrane protein implicated in regulation of membrane protease activity
MMAWWVWVVAGCGIAIFEIIAPAFVFLGFAVGAVLTGLILWVGVPPAAWMDASLPRHLLVFAVLSLLAWLALRAIFGLKRGQVKVWDRDINDN